MRRREFITLVGGAVVAPVTWPLAAYAQERVPRVGALLFGGAVAPQDLGFVRELVQIGYVDGRNIIYEVRGADGDIDRLAQVAHELVATNLNVIVGSSSPVAHALATATHDIPIVMMVMGDPIALGLTNSMSRPSRNVTGFPNSSLSLSAKRLELLRDLVPAVRKVAYLWVPANPIMTPRAEQIWKAAEVLGIELVSFPLTSGADIPAVFALADKEQVTAVLVESDALTVRFGGNIVDECLVRNLPAMHAWPFEVHGGALMAYGPKTVENYPRTANLCRPDLEGRQGRRLAVRGADRYHAVNQPAHGALDRNFLPAHAACAHRRGDRMTAGYEAYLRNYHVFGCFQGDIEVALSSIMYTVDQFRAGVHRRA